MENTKLDKIFQDYGVEPVPENETKNWLSMGLIWSGVGISLGLLMTGGALGDGLSFRQSITAAIIGGLVLALVTILCGIVGANTKLSTAMISRFTFGEKAVLLIALIQAFGSYGWFGVQLGLFGKTAATAFDIAIGYSPNVTLLIIIGGILMIITATIGYRGLDLLSKIAVPLLIILMFGSLFKVLQSFSMNEVINLQSSGEPISVGMAASMVISSFVVGAVVAPDVSRYAKSAKDTIGAAILAFVIVVPLVILIGAIMAQAAGTWDIVDIMLKLGWGLIALLVLLLAQWTSNDNNLYCSALGFAVVFKKLKKWQLSLLSGSLGIILAIFGIYDNFISWLIVLGVLIPPMRGVIAADYYLKNKKYYDVIYIQNLKDWRVESFISWIVGSVVSFITSNGLLTLTTVPALDGFIIAGLLQYILLVTRYKDQFIIND
ncbi:cytosine permease [Clostridium sp. Cult2]|uniref:cytosine permease n=1 Tax=Clostridium sp. Cult2 TaxID=2079003 RepID=UPI001F36AA17|nr:cytosine permease [Clostridium sp. Cult2]MCF6465948.1 cytosine permease [Clostridium sp. Cult2]